MSVESPKPNLKTKEDVLNYLQDKGKLKIPTKQANRIINSLLDLGKKYDPTVPSMTINILCKIGGLGINFSENQIHALFKELTGYELKDMIKSGTEHEEEAPADATIVEEEIETGSHDAVPKDLVPIQSKTPKKQTEPTKRKSLIDTVADAKITNLVVDMVKFGFKSYSKTKGESTLLNILKGTGLGALALTTIIGGSGAILAARAVRLVGKGLKAVKGTAAKAMHNKAVKDMQKIKTGLDDQKKMLDEFSKHQRGELDSKVVEYGLEAGDGYKFIKQLRDGKVTTEECENAIISEYDSVSEVRDINLSRIVNSDIIAELQVSHDIDSDQLTDIINGITFDEEGNPVLPDGCELTIDEFNEDEINLLRVAARNTATIFEAPESDKVSIFEYVELKDGKVQVKDGVTMDSLSPNVVKMIRLMQNKTIDSGLYEEVVQSTQSIEVLLMCEEEILTNTAIEANIEMTKIYADRGELVGEQTTGLFKSGVELITAASLRSKAQNIVERRMEGHINDSITRNNGATERLLTLARERLLEREVNQKSNENRIVENPQHNHDEEEGPEVAD